MVAAAMIGAAVIGAGASVASGQTQAKAAKKASNSAAQTERESLDRQLAFQREGRDIAERELRPYANEGNSARRMYNAAMGIAPTGQGDSLSAAQGDYTTGFEASPYWQDAQYSTAQAMNALQSTNAAMGRGGSINSGKAMRAASDITQGYRGNATNQYLNALGGISDTGFTASSGIASAGQNYANNASSAARATANAIGQYQYGGAMDAANARANGLGNAAGFIGWGAGQYANMQQPNALYFRPTTQAQPLPAYNPPPLSSASSAPNMKYLKI